MHLPFPYLRHELLEYATASYRIKATLALDTQLDARLPLHNSSAMMRSGKATLKGLTVPSPKTGQYVLTLHAPGLTPATVPVYIRGGAPAVLYMIAEPSHVTDNVGVLADQPVLGLQDSAGNVVDAIELQVNYHQPPPPPHAKDMAPDTSCITW